MAEAVDIRTWFREAVDAVNHFDAAPAHRLLRSLKANASLFESERKKSSRMDNDLRVLERQLRYVAFPDLPIEAAAGILAAEVTGLIKSGIDLGDRLEVRSVLVTYGDREADRKALKEALLSNQEKIGEFSVGQWLEFFDKAYPPMTRQESSIREFLTKDARTPKLSQAESALLQIILLAYERYIVAARLTVYDLAGLGSESKNYTVGMKVFFDDANGAVSRPSRSQKGSVGTVKLPLLKALAEYPRVGEQMVTSDKIRLKGQGEPQRPTLANWIRCYRDELGIGMHDQVTRGRFLFQSDNGKKLSTQDRDRINLIIKSLEEEFPLDVDTDRMQIVFTASTAPAVQAPATAAAPKLTFPSAPQGAPERPVRPYTPPAPAAPAAPAAVSVSAGKGSFLGATFGPAKNVAGDTLHFSTGHVLPGEKGASAPVAPTPSIETKEQGAAPYPMTGINRSPGTPLRNPYSIRPLRLRNTALDRESDAR